MALSITCSKISQSADSHIHVAFADGVELEFLSRTDAINWAQGADVSGAEAQMMLRRLLMSWWLKSDPTAATPATVIGKTITANLTLSNVVTVG